MPYISPEELQLRVQEIRRLRVDKFMSDAEIMRELKISKPTYYKYKAFMIEQNRELIKNRNQELLNEEIEVTKARLESIASKLGTVAQQAEEYADKVNALKAQADVVASILKVNYETPQILGALNDSGQAADSKAEAQTAIH